MIAPFLSIWFISSSTSSFSSGVIFFHLVKKFVKGFVWKELDIHELCSTQLDLLLNFTNFFAKCFPLLAKRSHWEIFARNKFFTKWCTFGYPCIGSTGTGYTEEGRFKFSYTNYVASSVLLLMIAKEIASFPTLQDEVDEALSKGLIIVAIIDRIIWLFVVNGDEKLPGFPSFFFLFFLRLTYSVIYSSRFSPNKCYWVFSWITSLFSDIISFIYFLLPIIAIRGFLRL